MRWSQKVPLRRDRYLDWQKRQRPVPQGGVPNQERVPVSLKVADAAGDLAALHRLVFAPDAGAISVKMWSGERAVLQFEYDAIDPVTNKPRAGARLNFFAYMKEADVYDPDGAGAFRSYASFKIQFAGPPIRDLVIDDAAGQEAANATDTTDITGGGGGATPVAIGIIDDGIAFAHSRFRNAQGTRIKRIWLQDVERAVPATNQQPANTGNEIEFGRILTKQEIDTYVANNGDDDFDIYRKLGVVDHTSERESFGASHAHFSLAHRAAHGTHVADIAAGYDPDDVSAPERPIFAVQLPVDVTADTSGTSMTSYVLQAVQKIFEWADAPVTNNTGSAYPLVINFSYGFLAGPKDGTDLLERELQHLIESRNDAGRPTALVLPSGNSYMSRTAGAMELEQGARKSVDWVLLPDDETESFLEIWIDGLGVVNRDVLPLELEITPPGGLTETFLLPVLGVVHVLEDNGNAIAGVYCDLAKESGSDRYRIFLATAPTSGLFSHAGRGLAPAGAWDIKLTNKAQAKVNAAFYVQRDDTPSGFPQRGRQSFLDHPMSREFSTKFVNYTRHDTDPDKDEDSNVVPEGSTVTREGSLSSIASLKPPIVVVGAATDIDPIFPAVAAEPSLYTSKGPTAAVNGPIASAFADGTRALSGVVAAGVSSGVNVTLSGTSMAAPQVSRLIADEFEQHGGGPHFDAADHIRSVLNVANTAIGTPVPSVDEQMRLGEIVINPPVEPAVRRKY